MTESEALTICRAAKLKPVRVKLIGDGAIVYLEAYPDVELETANKNMWKAGAKPVLWGNRPPAVWIVPMSEAPEVERELYWQPPVPTEEERA